MWIQHFLVFFFVAYSTSAGREEVTFEIPDGKIKGLKEDTVYRNKPYYSFKGIPYAKPKVGYNKFDPPERPVPWEGILDATEYRSDCIQVNPFLKRISGSEDCLFLNLFTPDLHPKKCFPVMVWIHGGGFVFGSGSDTIYGPDFLVEQNAIVITFNYRLGPLGFINTGDENAPGNVGLKDQSYALKWVDNHAHLFGGCQDQITIFGESAGSASVHYHLLSPMSRKLFDRAIMQSGSATDEWAYSYKPQESAFKLGEVLGIVTTNSKVLMNELKSFNATAILLGSKKMHEGRMMLESMFTWLPSVEPRIEGVEIFLPDHPMTLIRQGNIFDVPIMAGVNLDECALFLPDILKYIEKNKTYIYQEMHNLLPNNMNITDVEESKRVVKDIYKFYFGEKEISKNTSDELLMLLTDLSFFVQYHITTLVAGEHIKSPIYKYLFTYRSSVGLLKSFRNIGNVSSHADDLEYLWYSKFFRNKPKPGSPNEHFVHMFTKMWTNFARDGNPTSEMDEIVNTKWKPMGKDNNILNMNMQCEMQKGFFDDRMTFWIKLYNKVLGEFGELLTPTKVAGGASSIIVLGFNVILIYFITRLV